MATTPSKTPKPAKVALETAEANDADLIGRYLQEKDQAAFELLLRRHGSMVMGLLRRMGLQEADADDAFQATFLTLARKADAISRRDSLPSWLYKVAYRIAIEVREKNKRRHAKEQPLTGGEQARMEKNYAEFLAILDAEVMQLPEKYRVPFVLCHLQGMPLEHAAQQLGVPLGTVGTRLAKAREVLRSRMARRGLVLTGAVLAAYLSQQSAFAAPTPALVHQTMQIAGHLQNGTVASAASGTVIALSDGAIRWLFLTQVKSVVMVATAVVVTLLVTGAVATTFVFMEREPSEATHRDWLAQWGRVIDPDADSKFTARPKTLRVKVPPGPHVLLDPDKDSAPRIVRDLQGDFLVEVEVTPPKVLATPGAFEKNAFGKHDPNQLLNRSAYHGAGILLMQDANNFVKLQQGSVHDESAKPCLTWHTRVEGTAKTETALVSEAFRFLRVQRLGPHVFASGSPDGERWGNFPGVISEFGDRLTVGLIIEHNTQDGYEPTFSNYKTTRFDWDNNPQPPWKGAPAPPGCAKCHDGPPPPPSDRFQYRW